MIPFLKWAGGKRWLVQRYGQWLRKDAARYVDPFLGSGAVYFELQPAKALLGDLNLDLMDTYVAVRDDPAGVIRSLEEHQRRHSQPYYYAVRAQCLESAVERAARFIYLNRTCFNGLYRVNRKGMFNVPQGTKKSVLLPTDNFVAVSGLLRSARLTCGDFSSKMSKAHEGDFLFVDPPYTVRHNTNGFLRYNEQIFSWDDQVRLAAAARRSASRGAMVLLTNANHPSLHELYSDPVWQRLVVTRQSLLASAAASRSMCSELIVSNYLDCRGVQTEVRW